MTTMRPKRTHLSWQARVAAAAVLIAFGGLAWPGPSPAAAAGATATVGNGLATTDLSAVGMSPSALASTLVGPGVTVSNVSYTGAPAQAGTIHLVDPAVVSFNDGIIMSSGDIADVVGPNKSDGITGDMAGGDDADLNGLIADTQTVNPITFDAASLELDFVPQSDHVYFTYTWGSDEYLEWVNLFNDVFAFYINGQNCATVPGGNPVSIDTVNDAVNPDLFRDNSYSSPPANPINIESDGLSVEMICSAAVTPGQTNHMKLAIADTSDQILDSVVMIKAHSLSTTPPESCNDHVDNDDDALVDLEDDSCSSTTTAPPPGQEGIGSSGSAPPFTGNEGTPIPLDASALGWDAGDETLSTTWTVTGINGTEGSCEVSPAGPLALEPDGSIAVVTAVCPDEGEYVARVDGIDIEGGSSYDDDVDFFVHNAPPVVDVTTPAPGAQVTLGSTVQLAADVSDPGTSDSATCEISWGDGTTEPGVIADGQCTGAHGYDTAGQVIVSVTATDDAGDSAADASLLTVSTAGVTLASNANPSVKGQPVAITATTTLGTTGTMRFYDGATLVAARSVIGGVATLSTSSLSVGNHALTAVYTATSTSPPSASDPLDQQVDRAATTTLTANVDPSVVGQPVTIRATVATVAPGTGKASGTVDLYDGGALVATKSLSGGVASFGIKASVGAHAYTATYNGGVSYEGSTTDKVLAQQVDPASTSVAVTSATNPSVVGQSITLRTTVRPVAPATGWPSGAVDLYEGDQLISTRTLVNGSATTVLKPSVGPHAYRAVYHGSTSHLPSTTTTDLSQVVARASTAVTVRSTYPSTTVGHSGTISATVKAVIPGSGVPTGVVSFYDDGTWLVSVPLVAGKASIPIASLPQGVHPITATYGGDTSFEAGSTTTTLVQAIT